MEIIVIVGLVILAVFVLYLLAIMPRMLGRPDTSQLSGWYYAHRGLHDNEKDAPENSLAAARKAVEAGYGIELDVQLTKDRIPVVFHDDTLKRMCGAKGKVMDYTYEELKQFRLGKSEERIPKLQEFLELVNGRTPLIIEIKIYEDVEEVCRTADELIRDYKGVYCMESFHPLAVRWYRRNRPKVIRGQLSSDFNAPGRREPAHEAFVHYLLLNFICKPDFIAYDHWHKKNISRWLCRYLYRALSVAWTIRSEQELENSRQDFDLFIFEKFHP